MQPSPPPPTGGCGGRGSLCRRTQLRCPRLARAGPAEEVGYPGAGGGQLLLLYSKASNSPRLVRGRWGCQASLVLPNTDYPGEGVVQIRESMTPPLQPSTGSIGGAFVPLEKRGRGPPPPPRPRGAALLAGRRVEPAPGQPFCQHSVNTQYCIKAINSHFKETETQFSHQSQEQRLAGLRNVTAQLVAPPPHRLVPAEQGGQTMGCARLHDPSPQIRLRWWGVMGGLGALGSASSSLSWKGTEKQEGLVGNPTLNWA